MSKLTLTDQELQKRLNHLAKRATLLCGTRLNGDPMGASVSKALEDMAAAMTDPKRLAEAAEFRDKAGKDPKAQQVLQAIRLEQYNNYILASANVLSMFYENVELKNDEQPYVQNNTMQEIRVGYIGADGQPGTVKIVKPQQEVGIELHVLTTDEVRYRRVDPYRGSVAESALATIDLAYDMMQQREKLAFTLLTAPVASGGCFGAFTFTGNKANFPFVRHSRILPGNLPTSNDQTVPGTTNATSFRHACFKAALKYGKQWGNAFKAGPLVPTGRILLSSNGDGSDIADEITPTGQTSNRVADQLLEQGWAMTHYLGVDWTLIEDNTLAPGYCYVEFNRKPGRAYTKPGMDQEIVDTSTGLLKQNLESRLNTSIFGLNINSANRAFALRLKYRS